MKHGNFSRRFTCRLCNSSQLKLFLDLGLMPLAGDFRLPAEIGKEFFFPLVLYRCMDCQLVQVVHIIAPDILFADYRYLSSVVLEKHFADFAKIMVKKFSLKNKKILEIGSNDGVLLGPLLREGVQVLGIDPAANVAKRAIERGLPTKIAFFSKATAQEIVQDIGQVDAIFANNVLAHVDDMQDIFSGIQLLLSPEGIVVFEVHYLPRLLEKLQYDFFYHEHMSYYTVLAMQPFVEKFGLELYDVEEIPIHSGSIRVYLKHKKNEKLSVTNNVAFLLQKERNDLSKLLEEAFPEQVKKHKQTLVSLLHSLKKQGKRIVGYGASGRANILLHYCGINTDLLDYIIDASVERAGRYTPGTHIPIVFPEKFHSDNPDYVLLLAWNYADTIIQKELLFRKNGGKFIIPLPKVIIV